VFPFLRRLSPAVPTLTVDELASLLERDAVHVIDVRDEWEYRTGHLRGAMNVPLGRLGTRVATLRRDRPYAVICQSGSRSMSGTAQLLAAGFDGAASVRGGTSAWIRSGRPVVR
jgi:rhodanese-related sulfurtransferase